MRRKSNVVESVVEEYHGQDDSTGSRVSTHWVTIGVETGGLPVGSVGGRPDGEAHAHTGGRDEEESSSTSLVNNESSLDCQL
jgi:hypothetical protein